jgi:hAT family C-terminal dimerisation region
MTEKLLLVEELLPAGFFDATARQRKDEITEYLQEELMVVRDPIMWWRVNKLRYPGLFSMAMDILSIPAQSAECERQFSLAKLTALQS